MITLRGSDIDLSVEMDGKHNRTGRRQERSKAQAEANMGSNPIYSTLQLLRQILSISRITCLGETFLKTLTPTIPKPQALYL
jgi:hypothetical protein